MKKKILSILLVLVLVLTLGLVTGVPVAACRNEPEGLAPYYFVQRDSEGSISWSTTDPAIGFNRLVLGATADEARSKVFAAPPIRALADLDSISVWHRNPDVPVYVMIWVDLGADHSTDVLLTAGIETTDTWQQTTLGGDTEFTHYSWGGAPGATQTLDEWKVSDGAGDVNWVTVGLDSHTPAHEGLAGDEVTIDDLTVAYTDRSYIFEMEPKVQNPDPTPIEYDDIREWFSKIQVAINYASPGDTITVAAGEYEENVIVDKSLTLQGEDRGTTELKFGYGDYPSEPPLIISADEVTVSGFTIRSGPYIEKALGASGGYAHTIIVTGDSALLTGLHVIKEPLLTYNNKPRIGGSAFLLTPGLEGFIFTDSTVDSAWNGVYAREGSSDIVVRNVDFTYPGEWAILLKMITDATIEGNTFTCTADQYGVTVTRGSSGIEIVGNEFIGSGSLAGSHIGILLQAYATSTMGDVTILSNDISGFNTGILVGDVATSEISIHGNSIVGNTCGVNNQAKTMVNATNNWWGNASGPIPPGSYDSYGDKVSGNVTYEPWLLEAGGATYDKTLALKDGWTLVSIDKDITTDSVWVGKTLAYRFTRGGAYAEAHLHDLEPVDALYVKTERGGGIGINYSTGAPAVSSKDLGPGWNLISSATETGAYQVLSPLRYVQIGQQQGVGLTTLVSQGSYNQFSRSFYLATLSDTDWSDTLTTTTLVPFDGYWVYMNATKSFGVIPD